MAAWAGLVQLEKLDNEAEVEGFGPWEHLSFAVILSCSAGLILVSRLSGVGFESCGVLRASQADSSPSNAHL